MSMSAIEYEYRRCKPTVSKQQICALHPYPLNQDGVLLHSPSLFMALFMQASGQEQ